MWDPAVPQLHSLCLNSTTTTLDPTEQICPRLQCRGWISLPEALTSAL